MPIVIIPACLAALREADTSSSIMQFSGGTPSVFAVSRYMSGYCLPLPKTAAELLADFAWEKVPRQDIRIPAELFC